jgi:hypothetical protein
MLPGDSKEMNENIKNLWDAALEEFSKEHQFATIMLPEPLKEKFAELIVKECIAMCDVKSEDPLLYKQGVIFAVNRCQQNIKQHFGVEE